LRDFVVPVGVTSASLSFERFILNQAGVFFTPNSLDFTAGPNQQGRVDIITTTANPFSVAGGDVLQNIFRTEVGDPTTSGYTLDTTDLTALFQANEGNTLRLRFAQVDNQLFFAMGIDDVALNVDVAAAAVPEPASLTVFGMGAALIGLIGRRRKFVTMD
jgi:hypothetical protein